MSLLTWAMKLFSGRTQETPVADLKSETMRIRSSSEKVFMRLDDQVEFTSPPCIHPGAGVADLMPSPSEETSSMPHCPAPASDAGLRSTQRRRSTL